MSVTYQSFGAFRTASNSDKSDLQPKQVCQYIGAVFDSRSATVTPPRDRYRLTRDKILRYRNQALTLRQWMSLLGELSSLQDLTYRGRLNLRYFQSWINKHRYRDLDTVLRIDDTVQLDLQWWIQDHLILPGTDMVPPPPDLQLFTDASLEGWGAHMNDEQISGTWTFHEDVHVDVLELMAVINAVRHWNR